MRKLAKIFNKHRKSAGCEEPEWQVFDFCGLVFHAGIFITKYARLWRITPSYEWTINWHADARDLNISKRPIKSHKPISRYHWRANDDPSGCRPSWSKLSVSCPTVSLSLINTSSSVALVFLSSVPSQRSRFHSDPLPRAGLNSQISDALRTLCTYRHQRTFKQNSLCAKTRMTLNITRIHAISQDNVTWARINILNLSVLALLQQNGTETAFIGHHFSSAGH